MPKADESKARRTAVRIVVFLGILLALTCLGAVTFFQSAFGDLERGLTGLDARVAAQLPDGAVWQMAELSAARDGAPPTDGVHLVLVIGLPEHQPDADTDAELRATAWEAYCDAFAPGGLRVGSVAVGRAGDLVPHELLRCCGDVTGWEDALEEVPSLVQRTGREAPRDLTVVEMFGNGLQLVQEE